MSDMHTSELAREAIRRIAAIEHNLVRAMKQLGLAWEGPPSSGPLPPAVAALIANGRKMEAISALMATLQLSLQDAKLAVDRGRLGE
jgi:hypothetical protein